MLDNEAIVRRMGTAGALLAKSFGLIDQIFLCIVYSFKATVSLLSCCTEMKRAALEITQAEPCWDGQLQGTSQPLQTPHAEGPRKSVWVKQASQGLPEACSRQGHSHGHWPFVWACPEVLAGAQGQCHVVPCPVPAHVLAACRAMAVPR